MSTEIQNKANTRILVVEDHPNFRNLLCISINLHDGMEICGSAATGQKALDLIAETDPDLLLVDLSLPEMSGLDILDEVRLRWPAMRCIILSGHSEEGYVLEALNHGANGYILKGRPRDILEAIENSLRTEKFIFPKNLDW